MLNDVRVSFFQAGRSLLLTSVSCKPPRTVIGQSSGSRRSYEYASARCALLRLSLIQGLSLFNQLLPIWRGLEGRVACKQLVDTTAAHI